MAAVLEYVKLVSLLDIASSQDVPFCQPHSKHHGATFVPLCSSFLLLTTQGVDSDIAKQLPTGFSEATWFVTEKFLTLLFISNIV